MWSLTASEETVEEAALEMPRVFPGVTFCLGNVWKPWNCLAEPWKLLTICHWLFHRVEAGGSMSEQCSDGQLYQLGSWAATWCRDHTTMVYVKQRFISPGSQPLEVDRPLFHHSVNAMGISDVHHSQRRSAWKMLLTGRLKFKPKPKDFTSAFQL